MISTNRWEMWSPPEMHYGEDDEDNHIGFGLRRSQRLGDKGKEKEKADQSVPENTGKSTGNSPTAPPPNQEANKQPVVTKKRRPSYPGAWVEGDSDDGSSEASVAQEPAKIPEKVPEKEVKDKSAKDSVGQVVDKVKVGGGLRKKILKQSFTLTLEELLLIAPKFIQELQNFSTEEAKPVERSQNSGRCNRADFDEDDFIEKECQPSMGKSLTYACPLGFVNLTINGRKLRALVDSGAELNIMPEEVAVRLELPTREISMNITGIGGHLSPVVGLAEGISFNIDTETRKAANFFIIRGKVYTVLGRPFLADHKVRLELSQSRGEILSYELWDGGRLCIPICSPEVPGWEMAPPRRLMNR